MPPKRIVILGNAGSGKSSLARQLGEQLALPVVHLDTLFWGPNWTKPVASEFRARVRVSEAVSGSHWICEMQNFYRSYTMCGASIVMNALPSKRRGS